MNNKLQLKDFEMAAVLGEDACKLVARRLARQGRLQVALSEPGLEGTVARAALAGCWVAVGNYYVNTSPSGKEWRVIVRCFELAGLWHESVPQEWLSDEQRVQVQVWWQRIEQLRGLQAQEVMEEQAAPAAAQGEPFNPWKDELVQFLSVCNELEKQIARASEADKPALQAKLDKLVKQGKLDAIND